MRNFPPPKTFGKFYFDWDSFCGGFSFSETLGNVLRLLQKNSLNCVII